MIRKTIVLAVLALTITFQASAAEKGLGKAPRFRAAKRLSALLTGFNALVRFATTTEAGYRHFIDFTAVSNQYKGVATYFKGSLEAKKGSNHLYSVDPVTVYFSDRLWGEPGGLISNPTHPFDPKQTETISVQLNCFTHMAFLMKGSKVVKIPLVYEKGVYRGFADSGAHDAYVFSFKPRRQSTAVPR